MNPALRRILWVAALLACLVTVFFALRGGLALGAPPVTAAPTPTVSRAASSSSAETSTPAASTRGTGSPTTTSTSSTSPSAAGSTPATPSAAPAATPPSSTAPVSSPAAPEPSTASATAASGTPAPSSATAASADPAAAVMSGPAAPWDAITAAPTHIEVFVGEERLIGATIAPVQMRDDGELNPVPQTVGWYGPPQWDTTPGERSRYPGVLAGHVIHSGLKDAFWNLQELPTGAVVLLTYDDGTQALFRTDRPAETMDKDDLTHDPAYGWAWELPEAGHGLTLITCDLVEGSGMTGWSTDNWVTQAHRIA